MTTSTHLTSLVTVNDTLIQLDKRVFQRIKLENKIKHILSYQLFRLTGILDQMVHKKTTLMYFEDVF